MKNSLSFKPVAWGTAALIVAILAFNPPAIGRPAPSTADAEIGASLFQRQQRQVPSRTAADLEILLAGKPALKSRIVWVTGDGKRQLFDQWTPTMKSRIGEFYQKMMRAEKNLGMRLPALDKIDPRSGRAFFTADQAFDSYAASVAHVLFVEARRLVPWSIAARPAEELDALLASDSYVSRILPSANTEANYPAGIKANRDFAETPENAALGELNGDPRIGFDFLSGKTSVSHKSLIGKNELETLAHLTVWLRDNVGHGDLENQISHSSAVRWLTDRLRAAPGLAYAVSNNGCHSASKLMVDLARSVNIPLLHVRAQENDRTDGHFFNRTHGGLVYGWGAPEPRVLWHTDEIYADSGEPSFPLDEQTGTLAEPERAAQMYFDQRWVSPSTLIKAGFAYKLERVYPEKGFGKSSAHEYEDRGDYGLMIGYWRNKGGSKLEEIFRLSQDYALCGETLMMLSCKNILIPQLRSNIKAWKGPSSDGELHMLRPVKDYDERAKAWLNAVGGCRKFQDLYQQWQKNRGNNLLPKGAD